MSRNLNIMSRNLNIMSRNLNIMSRNLNIMSRNFLSAFPHAIGQKSVIFFWCQFPLEESSAVYDATKMSKLFNSIYRRLE